MTLFEKLTTFRRLVGSVPYVRSRKNFYSRLLSRIAAHNIDSDYCYLNLDKQEFPKTFRLTLLDIIEVPASQLSSDIIIHVYCCFFVDSTLPHIYYKVHV
ncbi:hypothetical protein [Microvirus sp.]|nr:hypothetical protein [Microvirus sp.]